MFCISFSSWEGNWILPSGTAVGSDCGLQWRGSYLSCSIGPKHIPAPLSVEIGFNCVLLLTEKRYWIHTNKDTHTNCSLFLHFSLSGHTYCTYPHSICACACERDRLIYKSKECNFSHDPELPIAAVAPKTLLNQTQSQENTHIYTNAPQHDMMHIIHMMWWFSVYCLLCYPIAMFQWNYHRVFMLTSVLPIHANVLYNNT